VGWGARGCRLPLLSKRELKQAEARGRGAMQQEAHMGIHRLMGKWWWRARERIPQRKPWWWRARP